MKLGNFELTVLSDGTFSLDGGAMFGVVPKPLWNKLNPADEANRIKLGLNCLLIQIESKNVLVDTGIGNKFDEKFKKMFNVNKTNDLISSLRDKGLNIEDIDIVINTHLHFDHCGGNTRSVIASPDEHRDEAISNRKIVPSFPNAEYIVQKREWEDAINPNERTRVSYLKENLIPIQEAGLLKLIDGGTEILPGIKTIVTGGHTAGHQSVLIESNNKRALYLGDLIPTTAHIKVPYVMGYDLYPLDTIDKKREILEKVLKEHWLLIFEHDPKIKMGYLEEEGKIKERL